MSPSIFSPPDSSVCKESACNAGDPGSTPGSGRAPGEGIAYPFQYSLAFLMAQMVKNPLAMRETWFNSWVGKIPWKRTGQLIPVFLTGESPWAEEPGGLQSMQSQRAGHHWVTKHSTQHSLCLYDMVFSSFIINCIFLNFLKAILTLVSKFFYCYDPSPVS